MKTSADIQNFFANEIEDRKIWEKGNHDAAYNYNHKKSSTEFHEIAMKEVMAS